MRSVSAQPGVLGKNRAPDNFHEIVRSETLTTGTRIGYAQMDRSLALERHILAVSEVPEAVRVSRRDGIVRAAQRPIRADSKVRTAYEHSRIGALRNKRECDQVSIPTMRPSCSLSAGIDFNMTLRLSSDAGRRRHQSAAYPALR